MSTSEDIYDVPDEDVQPASARSIFYVEWALETYKQNIPFLNDLLNKLVTINSSLVAGSAVFLGETVLQPWCRSVVMVFFLGALSTALWGMLPFHGRPRFDCPEEIEEHKERAAVHKRTAAMLAGSLMVLGFGLVAIGLVLFPPPPKP